MLGPPGPLSWSPTPGNFETILKNKYINQMLDNLLGSSKREEIEQFELFRALNEVFNLAVDGTLSGNRMKEFLGFARVAKEKGKLGFFLRDYQRMVDAGCDLERAYHWAYNDVLNCKQQ